LFCKFVHITFNFKHKTVSYFHHVHRSSFQVSYSNIWWNFSVSLGILLLSNIIKTRPFATELFSADTQTDRPTDIHNDANYPSSQFLPTRLIIFNEFIPFSSTIFKYLLRIKLRDLMNILLENTMWNLCDALTKRLPNFKNRCSV
jgi:hypothetical protein